MTTPKVPVRYIDIRKTIARWPLRRPQQWYFVIVSEGNRKPIAVSETYTNKQDCIDEARRIGSGDTTVFLRQPEKGYEVLRYSDLLNLPDPETPSATV